jgi:hypothetical protein
MGRLSRRVGACWTELSKLGIEMHSEIQTLDVGVSEFKYVYFKDPDDQYVSIVETSY